jgi:hypothetical protein
MKILLLGSGKNLIAAQRIRLTLLTAMKSRHAAHGFHQYFDGTELDQPNTNLILLFPKLFGPNVLRL